MARQSAVRAGSGGFDITTGGHTQLDGALIASTASADKNRLDTGTLGWRDIKNESTTTGSSYSVALSASGNLSESLNVAPVIGSGQANRDDQGITAAAVSEGNILIRSPENQTQDITGLRRETENTHDGVDVRGDIQGIRDDLAVQSEAAALGTTVLDAYSKYAQKQVDRDNAALAAKLESEGKLDGLDDDGRKATIRNHPAYNNTDYGPGSAFWTKGSAAAGLLAGALGGNLQAGAAAGAAPLLASLVKEQQNDAARAALHGIVAAALTQLAGGSSADGLKAAAAGAVTASVMSEYLVSALYGKKPEQLSADEKRLVSNLMSIVGGLAGYAVTGGDDVSMAALAANTARVEVENNALGKAITTGCSLIPSCKSKVAGQLLEIGVKAGITGVVAKEIAEKISDDDLDHLITLKMMGNDELTTTYLNHLQDKYVPSHTGNDQLPEALPSHTGNNTGTVDVGPNHTGNDNGQIDAGPNHTGGSQTAGQMPSNTGNTEGVPDLPTHYENSNKIIQGEHAKIRNSEGRPVGSVINDVQKSRPADILIQDDGRWVIKGNGGKVHVIEPDGEVVTSFYNPKANTDIRVRRGEWNHPSNEQLEQFKQKFSDYIKW